MKLGFIGTGKITSAVVTGICRSKISFKKILLSPRNRNVARELKKKFKTTKINTLLSISDEKNYSIAYVIIEKK